MEELSPSPTSPPPPKKKAMIKDEGAKEQKCATLAWGKGGLDFPFILSKIVATTLLTDTGC